MNREKKSSKNAARGLFLGGSLSLLLCGLALGTATYAWWDIASGVTVDQFLISTSSSPKLEIGVKGQDGTIVYGDRLTDGALGDSNEDFVSFAPLGEASSMFTDRWLTPDFDYENGFPSLYGPYWTAGSSVAETPALAEGILQFEFYFLSDLDVDLYLDDGTEIAPLSEVNALRAAELSLPGVTAESLDKVVSFARVSFLSEDAYTILAPGKHETTLYGGILNLRGNDPYYDYKDGKEIVYGETSGTPSYLPPLSEDSEAPASPDAFSAVHKAGIARFDPDSPGFSIAKEPSYSIEELALPPDTGQADPLKHHPLASLEAGVPKRVVVSIYAEGWDTAFVESASYGAFTLTLSFGALQRA